MRVAINNCIGTIRQAGYFDFSARDSNLSASNGAASVQESTALFTEKGNLCSGGVMTVKELG
jgi:hypothetical protein